MRKQGRFMVPSLVRELTPRRAHSRRKCFLGVPVWAGMLLGAGPDESTEDSFAGTWIPFLPKNDEIRKNLHVVFEPPESGEGFQFIENGELSYVARFDGVAYQSIADPSAFVQIKKEQDRIVSVRTWSRGRYLSAESISVTEDGETLTRRITIFEDAGTIRNEVKSYRRVRLPDTVGKEAKKSSNPPGPAEPLHGRWVWIEGLRDLERSPREIKIIEAEALIIEGGGTVLSVPLTGKEAKVDVRGLGGQALRASARKTGQRRIDVTFRSAGQVYWTMAFELAPNGKILNVTTTQADRPGHSTQRYDRR